MKITGADYLQPLVWIMHKLLASPEYAVVSATNRINEPQRVDPH